MSLFCSYYCEPTSSSTLLNHYIVDEEHGVIPEWSYPMKSFVYVGVVSLDNSIVSGYVAKHSVNIERDGIVIGINNCNGVLSAFCFGF